MLVSLEQVKEYLRIDYNDEDTLLESLICSAEELCASVVRMSVLELMEQNDPNIHIAVMYCVAYLYEHREDANHNSLVLTLRALLFGLRKEGF